MLQFVCVIFVCVAYAALTQTHTHTKIHIYTDRQTCMHINVTCVLKIQISPLNVCVGVQLQVLLSTQLSYTVIGNATKTRL